jgi:hypothetical protein
MAKKSREKSLEKIVNAAAVLAVVGSLFAATCWITAGKAGGLADDGKTKALSSMILRLESSTEASNERVQAQTYLTQAGMYFAYAEKENNENTKETLENLGYISIAMSNFHSSAAENAENRAQSYYGAFEDNLISAAKFDEIAGNRSTGALVFNVAAMLAEVAVLIKRREILFVCLPVFAIGAYYLMISLV